MKNFFSSGIIKFFHLCINLILIKLIVYKYSFHDENYIITGISLIPLYALIINLGQINYIVNNVNFDIEGEVIVDYTKLNQFLASVVFNFLILSTIIFAFFPHKFDISILFSSLLALFIFLNFEYEILKGNPLNAYIQQILPPVFLLIFFYFNFTNNLKINFILAYSLSTIIIFYNKKNDFKLKLLSISNLFVHYVNSVKVGSVFIINTLIFLVPIILVNYYYEINNFYLAILILYKIFSTFENTSHIFSNIYNSKYFNLDKKTKDRKKYFNKLFLLNFLITIITLIFVIKFQDFIVKFFEINESISGYEFILILLTYFFSTLFGSFLKNNIKIYGINLILIIQFIFFFIFFILFFLEFNLIISYFISYFLYKFLNFFIFYLYISRH